MIEIEREKIGGGNERGEKRKRNGSDLFRKASSKREMREEEKEEKEEEEEEDRWLI